MSLRGAKLAVRLGDEANSSRLDSIATSLLRAQSISPACSQ
ncbi:MAG: hypothetical protein ACXVIY_04615 [Mucilaginibacter sp.]